MNINTTINLDDLLNSNEENSSEEVVEILKESITETAKSIEENAPLPDFDAIVTEWSYRCDKGYPDMKNKLDMIKLQEILNEMGVVSPFKQIEEETPKKKSVVKKVVKKLPTVDDSKSYGIGIPIDPKDTATIKAFKTKLSKIDWENKDKVNTAVLDIFYTLSEVEQKKCVKGFQTSNLETYVNETWTNWRSFFNINPTGMGRGEAMTVMAVKGASSGGTQSKDLITTDEGIWEIKEQPDSIRLAKSGAVGKFNYANSLREFYKLLKDIKLDDVKNDDKLKKNLQTLIGKQEDADKIFNILVTNFRGEGFGKTKSKTAAADEDDVEFTEDNFFERIGNMTELPLGVIELHYLGFKALNGAIDIVKQNKDLLANAKIILRTPGDDKDPEFFINPKDADKIKSAGKKALSKVDITIAKPATKSNVTFLYAMLNIMRHEFVKDPDAIPKDFKTVLDKYFATAPAIEGILWFFGKKRKDGSPIDKPNLGRRENWTIYGISQSQAKVQRRAQADTQAEAYTFMKRQLAIT